MIEIISIVNQILKNLVLYHKINVVIKIEKVLRSAKKENRNPRIPNL